MIDDLRIECDILRAKLRLNKKGSGKELAKAIGVNANSFYMALSGLRNDHKSEQLLEKLRDYLASLEENR